ncbi:SGNH/GDSL hydrolase family protein [Stenotrophomonas sp. HITSZ_GD]|uniref:SGNH/GDSL hydrolase family protein n=1 Tax=Stenotrophomonas sp. HITSZ_GD TaxID=3037248 RepID=UPI00240E15BC|nr:SGNH/GDSL hydrolase family protein [Stenotrophomonas sp. HITSZ_GD]MDG2526320.1 SGNH/GDSL hydrolase family protein [Stenotrophomonas sp. HITSZ_GD]
MTARLLRTCALLLLLAAPLVQARAPAPAPRIPEQVSNPDWEGDIARFQALDAQQPPPKGAVLFVGSSSIRFWDSLATDFPGQPVINRGFGGSEVRDSTWYADRIVIPYAPRLVVFYAGDNDLNAGRTPQQVRDDFLAFVARVRRDLPKTRIAYISIKPSPSRAQLMPQIAEANRLIRQASQRLKDVDFLDIYTPMLGADGQPRPELFREDMLHMKPAGYAIWREVVAPELAR